MFGGIFKSKAAMEHETVVKQEREEYEKRRREQEEETERLKTELLFLPLSSATALDYAQWMRGFIKAGGRPSHHYGYNMPDSFVVAYDSFECPRLCGVFARNIIVPEGVEVEPNGHCNCFYLKDFTAKGGCVPMYNDIAKLV